LGVKTVTPHLKLY